MEISVSEFISLLKAFNKDNNGIVAIKTGEIEKKKPVYLGTCGEYSKKLKLENQIIYGVGGEYIPEEKEYTSPSVTGGSNQECNHNLVINKICHDCEEDFRETYFAEKENKKPSYNELVGMNRSLKATFKLESDIRKELKNKITKLEGLHELLQASCQETVGSYENKIKEHQNINYKLCEEKRKLEKENQELKAEIESLEQKKINLEVDLEEQKSLVNTTRKLWEKLEKENQELKSKWYFWQVEAEKKETNNQELKAEIEYIKMHYVKIVQ